MRGVMMMAIGLALVAGCGARPAESNAASEKSPPSAAQGQAAQGQAAQGQAAQGQAAHGGSVRAEGAAPIEITERSQRDAAVGKLVTLRCVQTRTKIPTACGVDISGAYEHSDKLVTATGILHRWEVKPEDVDNSVANRGPGVFYRLSDPKTGGLAETKLAE
jgi:hypothetical protein